MKKLVLASILSVLLIFPVSGVLTVVDSYALSNSDGTLTSMSRVHPSDGTEYSAIAQGFTAQGAFILKEAKFELWKSGTPAGCLVAQLYTPTASEPTSMPQTATTESSCVTMESLTEFYGPEGIGSFTTFTFTGATIIEPSKTYFMAVVVQSATVINQIDTFPIAGGDGAGSTHPGAIRAFNVDGWTALFAGSDYVFEITGEPTELSEDPGTTIPDLPPGLVTSGSGAVLVLGAILAFAVLGGRKGKRK